MVYLLRNRLINCQSHSDTLLEFSEGVNVIIAPNGTGKSVFFKMLILATFPDTYNRDEKNSLKRFGEKYAVSLYEFSDGSESLVKIENAKSITHYYRSNKEEKFKASNVPFPETIEKLGVLCDDSTKFFANILDQDQALLFVKKSGSANNLVKLVVSHPRLDQMLENITNNLAVTVEEEKRLAQLKFHLDAMLNRVKYTDLASLENTRQLLSVLLPTYEELVERIDGLEVLQEASEMKDYESLITICDFYLRSVDLLDNFEVPEDSDAEDEVILAMLEMSATLESGFPLHLPEDDLVYDMMESLADFYLKLGDIFVGDDTEDQYLFDMINLVFPLYEGAENLHIFDQTVSSLTVITSDLLDKEIELSRMGNLVEGCPIYGAVQHVGESCIPIGNRSSLDLQESSR